VKGTRQPNGSVLATKIDIDNPDPDVEVNGVVAGRGGSCPALTFTVNGVTIATQAATRYEDGLCGDIQNGTRVEVKGIRQSNGTVLADKIDIDHPDPGPEVEIKGLVSNLGGACPNRTFAISGTQLTTNSATRFDDGSCGTLQNGTRVEVKGTRMSNGSVLARKVDIDR
jgi:hypothetical protein